MCDVRGSRDVSDVPRRHAASVNVPAKITNLDAYGDEFHLGRTPCPHPARTMPCPAAGPTSRASPPGPAASPPPSAPDAELLEAAAWLHDIGYLPDLARTGLHGLDGARYLRDVQHADPMLCRLVAHHSCAVIEAEERGLADLLRREFAPAAAAAGRRADLLRHDHQPRRRAGARDQPPGRDPRPLRLRSPGQPVDPPRHPADPRGRRPRPRQQALTTAEQRSPTPAHPRYGEPLRPAR